MIRVLEYMLWLCNTSISVKQAASRTIQVSSSIDVRDRKKTLNREIFIGLHRHMIFFCFIRLFELSVHTNLRELMSILSKTKHHTLLSRMLLISLEPYKGIRKCIGHPWPSLRHIAFQRFLVSELL